MLAAAVRSLVALGLLLGCFDAAHADPAEFYKGRQISLVVNYTSGGPTDTEARLLARHLSRHVPGNPTFIVRNMGGAGGMIGINWLGQLAPQDGFTMGYVTGLAGAAAHDTLTLKVDATKFGFVAGVEGITVVYGRSDLGGGMSRPEDLLTKKDFWIGGLSPDNDKDLRLRAELDLLGLKYHYVSGYPGAAEARLALERSEIQLSAESMPTYRMSIEPGLVKPGQAIPLWYDVVDGLSPHPDAAGIDALPFEMFYRKMRGDLPSGMLWEAHLLMKELGFTFQRVIVTPPNVPADALQALRAGIVAMREDPDYQRDALATIKFVPRFAMGAKAEDLFRSKLNPDPKVKEFLATYTEQGKAIAGK